MSQKERDAFMSGFLWRVFLDGAPGCDNEARAKAEAARRYSDAQQPEAAPVAKTRRCKCGLIVTHHSLVNGKYCPACGRPVEEVSEGGTT